MIYTTRERRLLTSRPRFTGLYIQKTETINKLSR